MRILANLPALTILAMLSPPAHAQVPAWVQLVDHNRLSARAIIESGDCPNFFADGEPLKVEVRSDVRKRVRMMRPKKEDATHRGIPLTAVTVCEARLRADKTSLEMEQRGGLFPLRTQLPLLPREIHRIVVFGDSGCRIKKDRKHPGEPEVQNCNDENEWPYAKVVRQAANLYPKPDLVIHVGDYHYREDQCPGAPYNCEGPWGRGYDVWRDDFFRPSRPLFATAPWIMVRGNHEDCKRAGEGWFRFLDYKRLGLRTTCKRFTDPFVFTRGNLRFLVVDTSGAEKPKKGAGWTEEDVIRDLRQHLLPKHGLGNEVPTWLLTHKPIDAFGYKQGRLQSYDEDAIVRKAIAKRVPQSVQMLVAGHIHIFEERRREHGWPPQLMVGTGGDLLEIQEKLKKPDKWRPLMGKCLQGPRGLICSSFGYMVWDRGGTGWRGEFFNDNGWSMAHCTLQMRNLACEANEGAQSRSRIAN